MQSSIKHPVSNIRLLKDPRVYQHLDIYKNNVEKGEMVMKEINELNLPDDVRYAEDHEWARVEGNRVRVGLDDYAQDQLGDIVFVELPQVGDTFKQGKEFATVESVKAVVECYLPVGGEIIAVNTDLEESPELVNKSPYGDGWFVEVKPSALSEMDALMTNMACLEKLKGAE
jgi:glycine cleavage system H protein